MAKASEEQAKTKRVGDPELLAMNAIGKAMESLDETTQQRVLAWIKSKYSPPVIGD